LVEPELSIRGRLVDTEGEPVVRWRIQAEHWDPTGIARGDHGLSRDAGMQMSTTDAQGRFLLEHLVDTGYRVTAQPGRMDGAAHLVAWLRQDDVRPGPDELVLRLAHDPARPCFVTGRVVAGPGKPAPATQVSIYPRDPGRGFAVPTEYVAAGDGAFRI